MTVRANNHLISEILKSPNAPVLINRVKTILDNESERRTEFYNSITEQEKAEFINGEIIIHSPVKKEHNEFTGNLFSIFKTYVIENVLGFVGFEKILIQCTRNDYEPDLCFFNKSVAEKLKKDQSLFPIPDLVVEILSKSTEKRDRGIKFEDYQNHGVKEYWIIDPNNKTVEQYKLNENGVYDLIVKSNSGEIKSFVITSLVLPIKVIFDEKLTHQFVKEIYKN